MRRQLIALSICLAAAQGSSAQESNLAPEAGSSRFEQSLPRSAAALGESRPSNPTPPLGSGSTPAGQELSGPGGATDLRLYQPSGFRVGSFTFFPSITAGAYHDSNVFAAPRAFRVSDWAFLVRPEMALRLDGSPHAFLTTAFVERREYVRFGSENQWNAGVGMAGTVQIDPDAQFQGRFQYLRGHEDRGAGESVFFSTDRPLSFNSYELAGAFNRRWDRWWASVGAGGLLLDYDDPSIFGFRVSAAYRNARIGSVNARLGYVVAPSTSVFVEWAGNRRDFQVNAFDSIGYRVVGGLLFEPGPGSRVKGEIYAGYMEQDYAGAGFLNVSTHTYGGALAFLLTPDLTATVELRREAKESGLGFGTSLVESLIGGRLDYQILPNLVIGGGTTYLTDSFQGFGRRDSYFSPFASIKYFVTPAVTVGFDYRRLAYDADAAFVPGFLRDVYLLSLNARF